MIVFIAQFLLYLTTLFPFTAQYRDSGEMVTAAASLGIAHPPGYPLYTLLTNIFVVLVPFATIPYRLNVLSALGSACAVWLLYRLFILFAHKNELPVSGSLKLAAGLSAMVYGTSYLQWYLALVSEMYTLNTLLTLVVLGGLFFTFKKTSIEIRALVLLAFITGMGLGVRMDLLLITPAALWLLWARRGELNARVVAVAIASFFFGFSVFAYLYIRSNTLPMLDWNHPATFERLWGSIARKTHGGTLDLISESYAAGDNFLVGMKFYFTHLLTAFSVLGSPLALFGLYRLWKTERSYAQATILAWLVTCPLSIYISNIPPNTHAFAILEAHFLLPNTVVAIWFMYGIVIVYRRCGKVAAGVTGVCLVALNLVCNLPDNNYRYNFFDHDFVHNILRSTPDNGTVVMKKDVQVFSLWAAQAAIRLRRSPAIVAQGLSASPWYQGPLNKLYPDVFSGPLRSPEDWQIFYKANRSRGPVYFSGDAEYQPSPVLQIEPDGLLYRLNDGKPDPARGLLLLSEIYSLRGAYDYNGHHDFFTSDLVGDYAHGFFELGNLLVEHGAFDQARSFLSRGFAMQPLQPQAATMYAYSYFVQGNYQSAYDFYVKAADQYRDYLALAIRYRSLPPVVNGIRKDYGEAYLSAGVSLEKLNRLDESLTLYSQALVADPAHAKAYFNRGVA